MGRHSQGNRRQARTRQQRHRTIGFARHHKAQRSRPERQRQLARLCVELSQRKGGLGIRHMRDQRVEGGPSLGGIDLGHSDVIRRICTQSIDSLGREGHELPVSEGSCSGGNVIGRGHAQSIAVNPRSG